jgi:aspartyl-tRNA(Asn)/glutamyl-tRNA(Gln) amidotransferase subunit B
VQKHFLKPYVAEVLVADRDAPDFFEESVKTATSHVGVSSGSVQYTVPAEKFAAISSTAANLITTELFGRLNASGRDIKSSPISAAQVGHITSLTVEGTISSKIAKEVFDIVWSEGGDPRAIVETRGLKQMTDLAALERLVDDIIDKNPDKLADAKVNPKAIGWFVGQVMKASGGKANPQAVNDLLKKRIDG